MSRWSLFSKKSKSKKCATREANNSSSSSSSSNKRKSDPGPGKSEACTSSEKDQHGKKISVEKKEVKPDTEEKCKKRTNGHQSEAKIDKKRANGQENEAKIDKKRANRQESEAKIDKKMANGQVSEVKIDKIRADEQENEAKICIKPDTVEIAQETHKQNGEIPNGESVIDQNGKDDKNDDDIIEETHFHVKNIEKFIKKSEKEKNTDKNEPGEEEEEEDEVEGATPDSQNGVMPKILDEEEVIIPQDHKPVKKRAKQKTKPKGLFRLSNSPYVEVDKKAAPAKLRITFNDSLTSTYEYPSEQSLLEELPPEPGDFDYIHQLHGNHSNQDSNEDEHDGDDVNLNAGAPLKSTPGLGSGGGLGSYRSRYMGDYQLGIESNTKEKESSQDVKKEDKSVEDPNSVHIKPAEDDDGNSWSTAATADLLF